MSQNTLFRMIIKDKMYLGSMDGMVIIIIGGIAAGCFFVYFKYQGKGAVEDSGRRMPDRAFPSEWRQILEAKVPFYQRLTRNERKLFEHKVHVFLLNVRIVGMQIEVSHTDRVLIAASAIIPIFRFKNWFYIGLFEVLLYPDKFQIPTTDKMANGLVGWGEMDGRMMLSRKALHHGFEDQTDGKNVAVHEFIHLFDKADGEVDGILGKVMRESDIEPWLYIIKAKMEEIHGGDTDIRKYATADQAEFLAVVGEYFFEKPDQMRSEHPALYNALNSFFNPPEELVNKYKYTKDYDFCPCASGKTFDVCCKKNVSSL